MVSQLGGHELVSLDAPSTHPTQQLQSVVCFFVKRAYVILERAYVILERAYP